MVITDDETKSFQHEDFYVRKDKILNAKPNNEVIMNDNINKFTDGEEITSLKKLNRKTKRKVAKMMTKKLRNILLQTSNLKIKLSSIFPISSIFLANQSK